MPVNSIDVLIIKILLLLEASSVLELIERNIIQNNVEYADEKRMFSPSVKIIMFLNLY